MNRLYIKDMNKEQLEKVITESHGLQKAVSEDLQENEDFFATEIMDKIRDTLSSWYIAPFEYSYIDIKEGETSEFLKGCENIKHNYFIFTTEEDEILESLLEVEDEEALSSLQYNGKVKRIVDTIVNGLKSNYENAFDENCIINEFLIYAFENYSEHYIENNDFTKVKFERIVTLS